MNRNELKCHKIRSSNSRSERNIFDLLAFFGCTKTIITMRLIRLTANAYWPWKKPLFIHIWAMHICTCLFWWDHLNDTTVKIGNCDTGHALSSFNCFVSFFEANKSNRWRLFSKKKFRIWNNRMMKCLFIKRRREKKKNAHLLMFGPL